MSAYNIVLSQEESTVVTEYEPISARPDGYQSEAALEAEFIRLLGGLFTMPPRLRAICAPGSNGSTTIRLPRRSGRGSSRRTSRT